MTALPPDQPEPLAQSELPAHSELPDYPDLADDLVRLRAWTLDDLPCIEKASAEAGLLEGTTLPAQYSVEEGAAFIEWQWSRRTRDTGMSFAVADPVTDEACGLVFLGLRRQPRTVGLGYWLLPEARGRGMATSAVLLVSRWALAALADRVEALAEPENKRSRQVLLRAGFQLEGLLRSYEVFATRRADVLMFSLLPGDFER